MKTVFNNSQCAHVWAQQSQPSGRSNSTRFDGPVYYSYATPIACIMIPPSLRANYDVTDATDCKVVLISADTYSPTTAQHINEVQSATVHMRRFAVDHVIVDINASSMGRASSGTHAQNLEGMRVRFDKEARRMERATSEWAVRYSQLKEMAEHIDAYAATFGLPSLNQVSVAAVRETEIAAFRAAREARLNTPANIAKRAADKVKRAARKEAKEEAERIERNRTDEEKLARWSSGESDTFPMPWHRYGTKYSALLRVAHGRVETSQGAHVPLVDAMRAIRFIKIVKARGIAWNENGQTLPVGQFRVNRIDANGDIKAGCHRIMFEEIERIAADVERALELVSA
jgi:hypothetical protein